eukprot:596369-Rhodomonas_salina.3
MLMDLLRRAWLAVLPPFAAVAVYICKAWTRRVGASRSKITWDPEEKVWKVRSHSGILNLLKRPEVRANFLPGELRCM